MEISDHAELIDRIYHEQYCARQWISGPYGERLITYADYVASGQPLKFIEAYLQRVVLPTYANTHTEASFTGRQTGFYREEARQLIKQSVNAGDQDVLLFCGSGSTGAIDKLVRRLLLDHPRQRPMVFLGPYEHHSNILPWRESGCEIITVPLTQDGLFDVTFLEEVLHRYRSTRRLVGSFSAASNVTGLLTPVYRITALLHQYDALSFWDYAAGAPYLPIDMNPGGLGNPDALFLSAHKVMGGPSTPGILVAKRHLFTNPVPSAPGGGTVDFVTKTQQRYCQEIEIREEGGTPAIIDCIRAGLVFRLKDVVGVDYIQQRENDYITRALDYVRQVPALFILGNTAVARLGIMAFQVQCAGRYLHHNFVVALLNDLFGIQARGGCSCAGPYGQDLFGLSDADSQAYMDELDTGNVGSKPGWVRLNFNYFIPEAEFLFLLEALGWIACHGWKLLKQYRFDEQQAQWQRDGYEQRVNSLGSFLEPDPPPGPEPEREAPLEYRAYLHVADQIAQRALAEWCTTRPQGYQYAQIDHPLRWYTLADDIRLDSPSDY